MKKTSTSQLSCTMALLLVLQMLRTTPVHGNPGPATAVDSASCCLDRVGDADGAGGDEPTVGDVSTMVDAKFISGTCNGIIRCLAEADINQSGGANPTCDDITVSDISTLIDYLFISGSSLGLPNCGGGADEYTIERTLADGCQRNTIAFDALAFMTGNLGGQSFLPPGKVADFSGFQYLRDNDPTKMGHNTDFVTIVAFNMLHILTTDQVSQLVARAQDQVDLINEYAYQRFPLMKAFRRQLEGDIPSGSAGLNQSAVMACSADLYRIDGQISYDRAQLMGGIVRSLTAEQQTALNSLENLGGVGNWNRTLTDPLQDLHLAQDVNVAVMTYASEMYAWYAGSIEADTYFCPERQGTYFGSFYLKDWPAMGNPDYTIDEQLTARAGEDFLALLTPSQSELITSQINSQKTALYELVDRRMDISTELRRFMSEESIDSSAIINLSEQYGRLDGEICWRYTTTFAQVYGLLSVDQQARLTAVVDALGYLPATGAFLYSQPISMPVIPNTDFLFWPTSDAK